jgi:hypothetical protein
MSPRIDGFPASPSSSPAADQSKPFSTKKELDAAWARKAPNVANSEKVYARGISIDGSPKFVESARRDLDRLRSTRSGAALIQSIGDSGRKVRITSDPGKRPDGTDSKRLGWAWSKGWDGAYQKNGKPGKGADVRVAYDPSQKRMNQFDPKGEWYDGKEKWAKNAPADVTLFHELVHARDVTHGTLLPGRSKEGKKEVTNLELGTIGLKENPLNPFSENQYRKERGLPLRTSYLDPDNQA